MRGSAVLDVSSHDDARGHQVSSCWRPDSPRHPWGACVFPTDRCDIGAIQAVSPLVLIYDGGSSAAPTTEPSPSAREGCSAGSDAYGELTAPAGVSFFVGTTVSDGARRRVARRAADCVPATAMVSTVRGRERVPRRATAATQAVRATDPRRRHRLARGPATACADRRCRRRGRSDRRLDAAIPDRSLRRRLGARLYAARERRGRLAYASHPRAAPAAPGLPVRRHLRERGSQPVATLQTRPAYCKPERTRR